MHIPKSAGVSISNALQAHCPLFKPIGVIDSVATREATAAYRELSKNEIGGELATAPDLFTLREQILLYFCARQLPLVAGHFIFSERAYRAYKGSYVFITIVRNPVARLLSGYVYARAKKLAPTSFGQFLESDFAWQNSTMLLRYFSGVPRIQRGEAKSYLAHATSNLEKFDIIGTLDNLDLFSSRVSDVFKIKFSLGHENRAPLNKPCLSSDDKKKINRLCEQDLEIFANAEKKF